MEKFAGYGFNKSHSAAYALLSYQTAWLKAHYPAAFMAAVLSSDMDRTDKVVTLIDECNRMGLDVEPPGRQCLAVHVHGVRDARRFATASARSRAWGRPPSRYMLVERAASGPFQRPAGPVPAPRPEQRQPARARGTDPLRRLRLDGQPAQPRNAVARAAGRDAGGRSDSTRARRSGPDRSVRLAEPAARRAGTADPPLRRKRTSRCRNGATPCVSQASAKRSACISRAIRSPSTNANSKPIISGRIADLGGASRSVQAAAARRRARRQCVAAGPQRHGRRSGARESASVADAPASFSTTAAAASR